VRATDPIQRTPSGTPGGNPYGPEVDTPVLIVGGGPAGAVTALLLARSGWSVELVDRARFPRPKACGECVNPGAVHLLADLNLLEQVLANRPARLGGWDLVLPEGARSARGRFRPPDLALGVERTTFDHALLAAARQAGVKVQEGVRAEAVRSGGPLEPARVELVDERGGRETRLARILIGADGLRSRVAVDVGARAHRPDPVKASLTWRIGGRGPTRDRGLLVLGDGMTAGLAPVAIGASEPWNATLVVADPDQRTRLSQEGWDLLLQLFREARVPWLDPPTRQAGPWGSGSFQRPARSASVGRTLLVGDAGGYFDPLTGQGIYRALQTGRMAASLVTAEFLQPDATRVRVGDVKILQRFDAMARRSLAPGRALQRGIEAVVSRSRPRRACLTILSHLPGVTSALIRLTGDRPRTLAPAGVRTGSSGGLGIVPRRPARVEGNANHKTRREVYLADR